MADLLGNIWFALLVGLGGYCAGSVWFALLLGVVGYVCGQLFPVFKRRG